MRDVSGTCFQKGILEQVYHARLNAIWEHAICWLPYGLVKSKCPVALPDLCLAVFFVEICGLLVFCLTVWRCFE